MRRAIATRLAESHRAAPVFTIRGSARVDALLALRRDLNEATDVRISLNDLIVAAAARAHVAVPEMNVIWTSDAVRRFQDVDIAVAVATDAGLVTPVVRGVDKLTVSALARTTADQVGRPPSVSTPSQSFAATRSSVQVIPPTTGPQSYSPVHLPDVPNRLPRPMAVASLRN